MLAGRFLVDLALLKTNRIANIAQLVVRARSVKILWDDLRTRQILIAGENFIEPKRFDINFYLTIG